MSVSLHSSRPALSVVLALSLILAILVGAAPRPASADGAASTRNIILGAVAVAAAIIINNNIQHKRLAHDTVVGRTRDGGVVYADGRIVYPNGNVLYTSNGNGRVCSWYGPYNRCGKNVVAYYPRNAIYRHDRGNHYGWYKHGHRSGDQDENENRGDRGKHGDHQGD